MPAPDVLNILTKRALFAALCSLMMSGCSAIDDSHAKSTQALLDAGSTRYCKDYTDEFVQYMLTRGTPDDVTMMENAVGYRDDGQWVIESETLASNPGANDNEVIVDVRCTWTTPVEQLNGPVELKYKLSIDPDTGTIVSVEDAN